MTGPGLPPPVDAGRRGSPSHEPAEAGGWQQPGQSGPAAEDEAHGPGRPGGGSAPLAQPGLAGHAAPAGHHGRSRDPGRGHGHARTRRGRAAASLERRRGHRRGRSALVGPGGHLGLGVGTAALAGVRGSHRARRRAPPCVLPWPNRGSSKTTARGSSSRSGTGLTFSDGSPLDATDVRRSWLRVLDPARPSPLASLLDDVVGAAAYARGEGDADDVGIHADGRTLSIDLARPASHFPAVAAVPSLAVVPESIDDLARGPRGDTTFVATGAYRPRRWRARRAAAARQPGLLGRPAAAPAHQRRDRPGRSQRGGRLRGRDRRLDAHLPAGRLLDPLRPGPRPATAPGRRDDGGDAGLRHDPAPLRRPSRPARRVHGGGLAAPGRARSGRLRCHLHRASRRRGSRRA